MGKYSVKDLGRYWEGREEIRTSTSKFIHTLSSLRKKMVIRVIKSGEEENCAGDGYGR